MASLYFQQKSGAKKIRECVEKRNVETHRSVEKPRPQQEEAKKFDAGAKKEHHRAPPHAAVVAILGAEPRVRRRLSQRVREIPIGMVDERRREPPHVSFDLERFVNAPPFRSQAARAPAETKLEVGVPGAVPHRPAEEVG